MKHTQTFGLEKFIMKTVNFLAVPGPNRNMIETDAPWLVVVRFSTGAGLHADITVRKGNLVSADVFNAQGRKTAIAQPAEHPVVKAQGPVRIRHIQIDVAQTAHWHDNKLMIPSCSKLPNHLIRTADC
jgi:hypothetical protein